MTEGVKGKTGFQKEYTTLNEDIKKVLTEKRIKTTKVKEELTKINEKYNNIHPDWLKRNLIKLSQSGDIDGGKDEDLGIFLWKKK